MRRLGPFALVVLSGCLGVGSGPTLHLEYTIESLVDDPRSASFGPHCATAYFEDDVAKVERKSYSALGDDRPFLIVQPQNTGGFMSIGSGGYPMTFPAAIDPRINGTESIIARVDVRGHEVLVNDEAVRLPHAWVEERPGDWRASFQLKDGPDEVRTFRMGSCM